MIRVEEFNAGLGVLALQVRHPLHQSEIDAFHAALCDATDPAEWLSFCKVAARRFGWRFLPTVAEIADALQEFRGRAPLDAEAVEAYERVTESGTYTAEGGTTWTLRAVRERCGAAAALAFLEAGGHHAFASIYGEAKRRERFVAAYVVEARDRPGARLPQLSAGREPKALPAGDVKPSQAEAVSVLDRLRQMTGVEIGPVKPKPRDGIVRASEDRLALLRAQAERITADETVVEEG